MSLVFIDGFEDETTIVSAITKWAFSGGSTTLPPGRTGIGNARNLVSSYMTKTVAASQEHGTFIVGFGLNSSMILSGDIPAVTLMSDGASTAHLTLGWNNGGSGPVFLTVKRGINTGTILVTSSISIAPSTWNYIELKAVLHDTTGSVELRINGALAASATNVDTKNAGTKTVFDSIRIQGSSAGAANSYDDLYLCNGAGTINNDFLGDCTVETLFPNGNGDTNQFIGSDGNSTDNYLLVDEPGAPSATDYAQSSNPGDRDLYQLSNLVRSSGSIRGVQIGAYAGKDDAGARSMKLLAKTGGTVYASPSIGLSTTNISNVYALEQNPGTSALWTFADVNALQAGMEVV